MRVPAGLRCAVFVLVTLLTGRSARGAQIPIEHLNGSNYVSVVDVAARLGLRMSWTTRGTPSGRPGLALYDATHRAVLTAESRDTTIDGLRVFLGEPVIVRGGHYYLGYLDFERRLAPQIRPEMTEGVPASPRVIAIDPGHGGNDPGKENGRLHLQEKACTLDVALRLKRLAEAAGYRVVMTRESDKYVELPVRAAIANVARADLFVSIHFNAGAASDTKTHGTEVFTFPLAGQRSDQSWNDHRNDAETVPSPVNRFDGWSQILAESVHREVLRTLGTDDRGQKSMHLAALRALNCPAILVESAFLSSDAEGSRVASPAFRDQLAQALLAGIRGYASTIDRLRPKVSSAATAPTAPGAAVTTTSGAAPTARTAPTRP